jgi:hypothetical protein
MQNTAFPNYFEHAEPGFAYNEYPEPCLQLGHPEQKYF